METKMKVKIEFDDKNKVVKVNYIIENDKNNISDIGRFQIRGKKDFIKFIKYLMNILPTKQSRNNIRKNNIKFLETYRKFSLLSYLNVFHFSFPFLKYHGVNRGTAVWRNYGLQSESF